MLTQRTKSLVALRDLGEALIGSTGLDELTERVCARALELCGADHAILYYLRSEELVEVLALGGWESALLHTTLPAGLVILPSVGGEPAPYHGLPPGVPPHRRDGREKPLRAGLYVSLAAQDQRVGAMIVHTTRKLSFAPGEVALLQTFANQAAAAIQRTGLLDQLQAKVDELEAAQKGLVQKERLDRELELARQVQQSVLPRVYPFVPGFRFSALNEPARRVGGDFYDIIQLDENHVAVAVGDVSDKGLPAALYMALSRSLLLAEARRSTSPLDTLRSVNSLLLELGEQNMFVTMVYGVIDRNTRRFTFVRAGHDHPLLVRDGQTTELDGEGMPLGILDANEMHLTQDSVPLQPGDLLVLYSDGLVDILSPDGQPFGKEHLIELLLQKAHLQPADLCEQVFQSLLEYRGVSEQYDDMTLLVVQMM